MDTAMNVALTNPSNPKYTQQMFGAVVKSYYAQLLDVDPSRLYSVSIMPCVAKKHECAIPVMNDAGAGAGRKPLLSGSEKCPSLLP